MSSGEIQSFDIVRERAVRLRGTAGDDVVTRKETYSAKRDG